MSGPAAGRGLRSLRPLLGRWLRELRTSFARPEPVSRTPRPFQLLVRGGWERREWGKALATMPVLGGFVFAVMKKRGWESFEESRLLAGRGADTASRASTRTLQLPGPKSPAGALPCGRIGDLKLSRLFLGGNLIGGWAHARDLVYVSRLIKSYHTDEKVFETLGLAEACGINTILTNPVLCGIINQYWSQTRGRIQFISDCALGDDLNHGIQVSIDGGAHACYIQGAVADKLVALRRVEEIGKAIEHIRRNGLPAGIGAHELTTVRACVEAGVRPDFWVKTLHRCDHSSARPRTEHDNKWCTNPAQTIEYMGTLEEPWIAFKILAAGAIEPRDGFRHAFENGADFICVGMYDFQIVDNVDLAGEILAGDLRRTRPWRA